MKKLRKMLKNWRKKKKKDDFSGAGALKTMEDLAKGGGGDLSGM